MSFFQPKPKGISKADYYLPAYSRGNRLPVTIASIALPVAEREPGEDDEEIELLSPVWELEPELPVCREIDCFIAACTQNVRKFAEKEKAMNVAAFNQNTGNGDRLPFLDAKAVGSKGCTGKVLAARAVKTPKFNGLFLDVKVGTKKFSYGVSFDRFDLGAIVAQTGSDETDDWIGSSIRFITKKGKKKGQMFVNVAYPKSKAAKK